MTDERFREGESRHEIRRGTKGNTRLLAKPKGLIKAEQDGLCYIFGVESPLQARARQIVELTDAL